MKPKYRIASLALMIAIAWSTAPAQGGDCRDYRPLWLEPWQPIPPCAAQGGGPWTLNPFRFARGADCVPSCWSGLPRLRSPWRSLPAPVSCGQPGAPYDFDQAEIGADVVPAPGMAP
jgi:hypothetical protein